LLQILIAVLFRHVVCDMIDNFLILFLLDSIVFCEYCEFSQLIAWEGKYLHSENQDNGLTVLPLLVVNRQRDDVSRGAESILESRAVHCRKRRGSH